MGAPRAEPLGCRRIFENFQKLVLGKSIKMHYFSYFSKNVKNHALIFTRLNEKQFLGIFEKVFENVQNIFRGKLQKIIIA